MKMCSNGGYIYPKQPILHENSCFGEAVCCLWFLVFSVAATLLSSFSVKLLAVAQVFAGSCPKQELKLARMVPERLLKGCLKKSPFAA